MLVICFHLNFIVIVLLTLTKTLSHLIILRQNNTLQWCCSEWRRWESRGWHNTAGHSSAGQIPGSFWVQHIARSLLQIWKKKKKIILDMVSMVVVCDNNKLFLKKIFTKFGLKWKSCCDPGEFKDTFCNYFQLNFKCIKFLSFHANLYNSLAVSLPIKNQPFITAIK